MKKIISFLICTVIFLSVCTVQSLAFEIDPSFYVDGKSVSTLADAFNKAADTGSVITQNGTNKTVYPTSENIYISKDVTLITGKELLNPDDYSTVLCIEYNGNDKPLFTITNGGKLTLKNSQINLNDTDVVGNGKLIVVESGGTLVLDGTDIEPVTFSGSRDSLILVKDGGKIIFYGATFNGNPSNHDIYLEDGGAVIGDINGDRTIDIRDLVRSEKHLQSPETVPISCSLDFNQDGNVNNADLTLLKKHLLGL